MTDSLIRPSMFLIVKDVPLGVGSKAKWVKPPLGTHTLLIIVQVEVVATVLVQLLGSN